MRILFIFVTNVIKSPIIRGLNQHPFGLGSNDYKGKLRVPKNNWGAGYIVGNDNSYDNLLLLNKEGQKIFKKRGLS